MCNLHSLELARSYCGRLIGMAAGQVVFDGTPEQLTEQEARRLYGLESDPRVNPSATPNGVPADESILGVPAIALPLTIATIFWRRADTKAASTPTGENPC